MCKYLFRGFHCDVDGPNMIIVDGKAVKGCWRYGDLATVNHRDGSKCFIRDKKEPSPATGWKEVIPETVGQWSGWIDRLNTKIFVGDILGSSEYPFTDLDGDLNYCAIVITDEGVPNFCLETRKIPGAKVSGVSDGICERVDNLNSEHYWVIGNIYANPDLNF